MQIKPYKNDYAIMGATVIAHETDTDFDDYSLSDTVVSGSGSGAVVQLVGGSSGSQGPHTSTSEVNVSYMSMPTGNGWGLYGPARSEVRTLDDYGTHADTSPSYKYTNILRCTGFGFSIPSNATITGVVLTIANKSTWLRDDLIKLVHNGNEIGENKSEGAAWPSSYSPAHTYGGSTDDWNADLTYSMVNSPTFGIDIAGYNTYSGSEGVSPYIDYIALKVYYETFTENGTMTSGTIEFPSNTPASSWDTIEVNTNTPTNTTITWDVLKASDSSVLISEETGSTIDISSIENVDIKIRANLSTTNGDDNPSVDKITVTDKIIAVI